MRPTRSPLSRKVRPPGASSTISAPISASAFSERSNAASTSGSNSLRSASGRRASFNPFTFETRPTGGVLYRIVFHFAGLDPFPFRVVSYALMLANLAMFAALVRRVTQSAEIAVIAALLSGCGLSP